MRSILKNLGGRLSQAFLARPSGLTMGGANVRLAIVLCVGLCVASLFFTVVQWGVAEGLYRLQASRAQNAVNQLVFGQEMTATLSNVHRFTLNALLARDEAEKLEARQKYRESLRRYEALLEQVSSRAAREGIDSIRSLKIQAAQYQNSSRQIMDLAANGRLDEALTLRVTELRPIFNAWQTAQINFSTEIERLESLAQQKSARMITVARSTLLTLIVAPALVFILGLLAILGVLGWQHWGTSNPDEDDAWAR